MKSLTVEIIPHSQQRIGEVGDYWEVGPGAWVFRVSQMSKPVYSLLVLVHELVEWVICEALGIIEPDIFAFDKKWYEDRDSGIPSPYSEAGHDPAAPYHRAHVLAEIAERMVCLACGESWTDYDHEVMTIGEDTIENISARIGPKHPGGI